MTETAIDSLTEQQRRLCRENIERLKAFKANPPPAPPQKDYKEKPLTSAIPLPPKKRKRHRGPSELKRRAERSAAHRQKPVEQPLVTMVAIAPPPASSLLPA